jgi:signal transduction histidine kinase
VAVVHATYAAPVDSPQVGVLELDATGGVTWASAAAEALLPTLADGKVPEPLAEVLATLRDGEAGPAGTRQVEARLPARPGHAQHLVVFAEVLPEGTVLAVVTDVSWRKHMAHDLGNVLTRVRGFAELAQRRLDEGHPARDDLRVVIDAADDAWRLARDLAETLPPPPA